MREDRSGAGPRIEPWGTVAERRRAVPGDLTNVAGEMSASGKFHLGRLLTKQEKQKCESITV